LNLFQIPNFLTQRAAFEEGTGTPGRVPRADRIAGSEWMPCREDARIYFRPVRKEGDAKTSILLGFK